MGPHLPSSVERSSRSALRAASIVLSCAIGMSMSIASIFQSTFTVFVKPLAEDFGWSRTQLTLGYSLSTLALALCTPLAGRLADTYGPRKILLFGTPAFGVALVALGLTPENFALYVLFSVIVGVLGAGNYNQHYLSILSRWFDARLGLALGLAMAGTGMGLALAPMVAQALAGHFGWRAAYMMLGCGSAVIAFANACFLLRDAPSHASRSTSVALEAVDGLTVSQALRKPILWRVALCYLLMAVVINGSVLHLVPILTDNGMTATQAASIVGLVGIGVIVGRTVCGAILDFLDAGLVGAVTFAMAAFGAYLLVDVDNAFQAMAGIALIGLSLGVEGDLMGYVSRRTFGLRAYATIVGLLYSAFLIGVLIGPMLMSIAYDRLGGYTVVQQTFIAMALLAAVLHLRVLPRRAGETHYRRENGKVLQ